MSGIEYKFDIIEPIGLRPIDAVRCSNEKWHDQCLGLLFFP